MGRGEELRAAIRKVSNTLTERSTAILAVSFRLRTKQSTIFSLYQDVMTTLVSGVTSGAPLSVSCCVVAVYHNVKVKYCKSNVELERRVKG